MPLGKTLLDALDRMGVGGVILNELGHVVSANATADLMLVGANDATPDTLRAELKRLLRTSKSRFRIEQESWVIVERDGKRPLVIHDVPVGEGQDRYDRSVLILVDLDSYPQPSRPAVQSIFGLTDAEADLALRMAAGVAPAVVADEKGIKVTTIRSQLAAVFAKTRTTRQADLIALLARVAILP